MMVTARDIQVAARSLGLSGNAVCVHSSLRSFGWVEGGADTVVSALLAEGCTLLVPTFTNFGVLPPPGRRPQRNGYDYENLPTSLRRTGPIFTPETNAIAAEDMGAIPAAVVRMPSRVRGNHPLCSFTAVGAMAERLVSGQQPIHVNAPLEALDDLNGFTVLMGVGLSTATLLHLAEQKAGRRLFRRWAAGPCGGTIEVEVGGCSHGFDKLLPSLSPLMQETQVGLSRWYAFPAAEALSVAAEVIRRNPAVTHCGNSPCRCDDAVQGGPLLTQDAAESDENTSLEDRTEQEQT